MAAREQAMREKEQALVAREAALTVEEARLSQDPMENSHGDLAAREQAIEQREADLAAQLQSLRTSTPADMEAARQEIEIERQAAAQSRAEAEDLRAKAAEAMEKAKIEAAKVESARRKALASLPSPSSKLVAPVPSATPRTIAKDVVDGVKIKAIVNALDVRESEARDFMSQKMIYNQLLQSIQQHYKLTYFVTLTRDESGVWGFMWDSVALESGLRVVEGVAFDSPADHWNRSLAHAREYPYCVAPGDRLLCVNGWAHSPEEIQVAMQEPQIEVELLKNLRVAPAEETQDLMSSDPFLFAATLARSDLDGRFGFMWDLKLAEHGERVLESVEYGSAADIWNRDQSRDGRWHWCICPGDRLVAANGIAVDEEGIEVEMNKEVVQFVFSRVLSLGLETWEDYFAQEAPGSIGDAVTESEEAPVADAGEVFHFQVTLRKTNPDDLWGFVWDTVGFEYGQRILAGVVESSVSDSWNFDCAERNEGEWQLCPGDQLLRVGDCETPEGIWAALKFQQEIELEFVRFVSAGDNAAVAPEHGHPVAEHGEAVMPEGPVHDSSSTGGQGAQTADE